MVSVLLSGCGEESPKEIVENGLHNQEKIQMNTFNSKANIFLDFTNYISATSSDSVFGLSNKDIFPSEIHVEMNGKQSNEAKQMEANIVGNIKLMGNDFPLNLSIITTKDKSYISIPELYRLYNPDIKKYLSINTTDYLETEASQSDELLKAISEIDETLFTKEDVKNYTIKDGSKIADVITLTLDEKNAKPILQELIANDLLMDKAKSNEININNFKLTNVYDEDGFERKSYISFDGIITTEKEGTIGIKVEIEQNIDDINKNIQFTNSVPSDNETMNVNDLNKLFSF